MLDLVGNPEARFSRIEAHIIIMLNFSQSIIQGVCRRLDDLVLSNLASISSRTLGV